VGLFFRRRERELENYISLLRSEISDLRIALRDERSGFAAERAELLDRLMTLTQPAAYRELHPRPRVEVQKSPSPKRLFFPGYERSLRPSPPTSLRGPEEFEADVVEASPDGDAVPG